MKGILERVRDLIEPENFPAQRWAESVMSTHEYIYIYIVRQINLTYSSACFDVFTVRITVAPFSILPLLDNTWTAYEEYMQPKCNELNTPVWHHNGRWNVRIGGSLWWLASEQIVEILPCFPFFMSNRVRLLMCRHCAHSCKINSYIFKEGGGAANESVHDEESF